MDNYSHTNYKIMTEFLWDTVKDSKIKLPKAFIIYAGCTITMLVCVWNQHDWLTNKSFIMTSLCYKQSFNTCISKVHCMHDSIISEITTTQSAHAIFEDVEAYIETEIGINDP